MRWFLVGGALVTLFIWANLADPFNAPKSWILYITGSYLLGWVSFQLQHFFRNKATTYAFISVVVFILFMFLSFLATDSKFVGFFGENARRTGFATYFALAVFLLAGALLFNNRNLSKIDHFTLVVGPIVGAYGFLQHFNLDFIKWNNPYNSVLSTLGNPDFAAAVMGIFLVLTLGVILNSNKELWIRIFAGCSSVLLILVMYFSQIKQGFVSAFIGIFVLSVAMLWNKSKKFGIAGAAGALLFFVFGLFGMLNKGLLATYLYKESISLRGDYWRAAFVMIKKHPWFGVGLDRYGANFGENRDLTQILHHGPNVMSNAAHSVPLQLAATGGIFVALTFINLLVLVVTRSIIALKRATPVNRVRIASIFAAWITYEAQSFISIDNIGIAIIGWMLGGVLIGASMQNAETENTGSAVTQRRIGEVKQKATTARSSNYLQPLISGILVTAMIGLIIPLYLADSSMRLARSYAKPTSAQLNAYVTAIKKPLEYGFVDPHNKVVIATLMAEAGRVDEGIQMLNEVLVSDSRSTEALTVLSAIYEQTNRPMEAVKYRIQMSKLDPLNQQILLNLGQDYKKAGNLISARETLSSILRISPSTDIAKQARTELTV